MFEFIYVCHRCGGWVWIKKPLGIIEFKCPRLLRKEPDKRFVWTSALYDKWDKCNAILSVKDRL